VVVFVSLNGQSNWFEGVLLLALYAILGIAFFYIPATPHGGATMPAGGQ
jgi:Ca2+:H+ antiporter